MPSARERVLVLEHCVENDRNRARILLLIVTRSVGAPPFEKTLRMRGSLKHIVEGTRSRWISKPLSVRKTAEFPVVAIGASAGGLDACRRLLDALPSVN
jgi:chemotaxis response regulator CheB